MWRGRNEKVRIYHYSFGQPYDLEFKVNNGKMYCSELVWLIYKEHGIELCKSRKVSSFAMTLPEPSGRILHLLNINPIAMQKKSVSIGLRVAEKVDIRFPLLKFCVS